jgi:hypothetical protein
MKKLLLILVLLSFALPVAAQEQAAEEPEPYTRADNECYEGGTMEGQCNRDIDGDGVVSQSEIDWAWNCGWYMSRFNDGVFTRGEVPSWCAILLPPLNERELNTANITGPGANCITTVVLNVSGTWCFEGIVLTADLSSDGTINQIYYVMPFGDPCPSFTVPETQAGNFISPIGPWLVDENGVHVGSMVCKYL